jgi:Leucine-rich repeat (LRR) protein
VTSSQSILLDCLYKYHDWHSWGTHYTCYPQNVEIQQPNQQFTSLSSSKHAPNKTFFDVLGVSIGEHENCFYIPSGFDKFFPNADEFYVMFSKLQRIQRSDFVNLKFVRVISFYHNEIKTIPEDTFVDMVKLEYLSLSFNHIKALPDKVFQPLVNLIGLYLHNNEITEITYNHFQENIKLEAIWLQHNELSSIDKNAFDLLTKLKFVDLIGNMCINKNFHSHIIDKLLAALTLYCDESSEEIESTENGIAEEEEETNTTEKVAEKPENSSSWLGITLSTIAIFVILILSAFAYLRFFKKNVRTVMGVGIDNFSLLSENQ